MSLISELKKCEEPAKDAKEVLDNIAANPTLASFLIPSKRSLSTADYCAYYLLSPLMVLKGDVGYGIADSRVGHNNRDSDFILYACPK